MNDFFRSKRLLVTGACGTVGKELVRQLLEDYRVNELVGIDNNESELFFLEQSFVQFENVSFFLADIRDRNLFTRGRLEDFEVSPGEIGERMSVGKYYIIKVVFKPPLAPGVPVSRKVAYNIYDAFGGEDVSFMFVGDYPTDDVVFRVVFPPQRLPHRTKAFVKIEGRTPKPAELERASDGAALEWRVGRMRPGEQYHVEWSW